MPPRTPESVPGTSTLFRLLVIAAMAAAALIAWPCLAFPIPVLRDTIFHYRVPNHVLQSILSRASNEIWRFVARPKGLPFSETAVRLPGFFAGLAAVGALAVLLARLGFPVAGMLAGMLLALGFRRMVTSSIPGALFALVLPLAAGLCVLETKRRDGYLFEWYVIFLLPAFLAFGAIGLREIFRLLPAPRWQNVAFATLSLFLLSAYVAWTAPQRDFLRGHSLQPYRESVALTRPTLDPLDPAQDRILTTTFYSKPFPYDPRIILFANGPELGALVRRAGAEHKTLFVNLGFLVTVKGEHPNKYRFLKESGFFDDLGILPGFMETLGRHVFLYRPGTAAGFDFSTIAGDIGRSDKDQKTPAVDIGGGKNSRPSD